MHSRQEKTMRDEKKKVIELSAELSFEEVLELVQPMITSILVKCRVYKEYDYYRHVAAIAVWEAWQKANLTKGVFSSYIYTTVRGSILKEISKEQRYQSNFTPVKDEMLNVLMIGNESIGVTDYADLLEGHFKSLSKKDIELLYLLYVDGYSYIEIAHLFSHSVAAIKKRRTRLMAKIRNV